jgi:hypothetical protein
VNKGSSNKQEESNSGGGGGAGKDEVKKIRREMDMLLGRDESGEIRLWGGQDRSRRSGKRCIHALREV